jgi:hypothetical protein
VAEQAAHEDDHIDVRRLLTVDRAGLDGVEDEAALRIGAGAEAAEAAEFSVGSARIGGMGVAALRIGLPDLDHRVADQSTCAVKDAADDADPLSGHVAGEIAGGDAGKIVAVLRPGEREREERADGLRRRLPGAHLPLSIGVSLGPRSTMSKT